MPDDFDLVSLIALRRARQRRHRPRRRLLLVVFAAGVVIVLAVLAGAAVTGRALVFNSCDLNSLRPVALGSNSFLFASDGSLLGVIPSATNRQPLALDKMSPWLPKATVAIEDSRFWQHGALDYQGIARALYKDVSAGHIVEGGSTITQQLVRNLYIGKPKQTLSRKMKEACLAEKLAKTLVEEADPRRLSQRGVLRAPRVRRAGRRADVLLHERAPLDARRRQRSSPGCRRLRASTTRCGIRTTRSVAGTKCSRAMLRNGLITSSQYARAVGDPIGLKPGTLYSAQRHPNFFGWASEQLVKRFGAKQVEAGGLQVRTTLDPRMQYAARAAVGSVLREKTDPGGGARRHRSANRRRQGDGVVSPRRAHDEVQPRVAGGANGGQRVQALHARCRDRPGHLGVDRPVGPVAAHDHRPEVRVQRRAVGRAQLRRRVGRLHEPARRNGALGQHDLRAARRHRRPGERRAGGAQARHHVEVAAGLLDRARHAGRQSARDDERVRDACGPRRPSRPAGVRVGPRNHRRPDREAERARRTERSRRTRPIS